MAFSFRRSDPSLTDAVRRIAQSQIGTALEELDDPDLGTAKRVHQIRKRCKKVRGLVRLVRPGFDDYAQENAAFRDLARSLSGLRDAAAGFEVLGLLEDRFAGTIGGDFFATVRRHIESGTPAPKLPPAGRKMSAARKTLEAALARTAGWQVDGRESRVLIKGIAKTYQRAVEAMDLAGNSHAPADFHEWRKRAKYHWYHMRLLKRTWPDVMHARVDEADRLTEDLGDQHDLFVLRTERLAGLKAADARAHEVLQSLIVAEEDRLARHCLKQGRRLFAENTDAFTRRIGAYWNAWRD